jgi:hypothetical protein
MTSVDSLWMYSIEQEIQLDHNIDSSGYLSAKSSCLICLAMCNLQYVRKVILWFLKVMCITHGTSSLSNESPV